MRVLEIDEQLVLSGETDWLKLGKWACGGFMAAQGAMGGLYLAGMVALSVTPAGAVALAAANVGCSAILLM